MTDHADLIETIRRLGTWVPPKYRAEFGAAVDAVEAELAAGLRARLHGLRHIEGAFLAWLTDHGYSDLDVAGIIATCRQTEPRD